jgi:hypothetical protein
MADADFSEASARRWPRRISRPPSTRLGPAAIFDGRTRSRAEGGTGRRHKTKSPRGIAKGTEVACGTSSPRRTARGSNYARLIRHSVGQKASKNWHITGMPQFAHCGRDSLIVPCQALRSAARGANGHVATKPAWTRTDARRSHGVWLRQKACRSPCPALSCKAQ